MPEYIFEEWLLTKYQHTSCITLFATIISLQIEGKIHYDNLRETELPSDPTTFCIVSSFEPKIRC